MSDTDSVVLTKPLPDHLIGDGIGQMKLVHEIKEGIFIKKKLYCLIDNNNQVIIKSSGIDPNKLNYNHFINLLNELKIEVPTTSFNVDWKTLNIKVVESKLTIYGLLKNIKTIYNTRDVNFKSISFPIKYSIIIHPLYPILEINKNNLYNISTSSTSSFTNNNKNKLNNKDKLIIFIFLTTLLSSILLLFLNIFFINK